MASGSFEPAGSSRRIVEHLPAISVVALTAMSVVAHLVPCDAAAAQWHNVAPIMLWMLLLFGWALAGLLRGELKIVLDRTTAAVLMLTLVPAISAAYIVITGSGNGRLAVNLAWQWAQFGVMFFLARQWLRSAADARMLAAVMVAIAAMLATFALVQYAVIMPQSRAEFERDPVAVMRSAGIEPTNPTQSKRFKDRLESTEPTATFALTNSLAGLLTPWLVMLVALSIAAVTRRQWQLWRWLVPMLILAVVLLLTKSRTALSATMFGIGLAAVYVSPLGPRIDWRIPVVLGGLGLLVLVGGVLSGIWDVQVFSEAPKSVLYRLEYWQATASLIRRFPLLGAGPGNFQDTYKWFQLPEASENIADPHNFVFEIGATAGALGLVALAAVAWCFVTQLRRAACDATAMSATSRLTAPFRAHVVGVVIGVVLGFGCGFLADLVPGVQLLYTGLPVGLVVLWLLRPWIFNGELTLPMLLIPLVALLVNLFAAGGISSPGVATSVWWLVVLALVVRGTSIDNRLTASIALSRNGQLVAVLVTLGLGVLYHRTVYDPVFRMPAAISEATVASRTGRTTDALNAAAMAAQIDPLSPLPYVTNNQQTVDLSDLWFQRLALEGDTQTLRSEFKLACESGARLDPRSENTFSQIAHRYLALYRRYGRRDDLEEAQHYYQQAVERFPNHALGHAQLAWVLHLAGDQRAAAAEAQAAYELDRRHGHVENKLAALMIYDTPPAPNLDQPPPPAEPTAEPIVERLRTASTP